MTCTKESFLKDVKYHKLHIERDDGLFRSIVLGRPDSCAYKYRITTFPYHLCLTGDMGAFVFSRDDDMFTFFRADELEINDDYWRGKLVAHCNQSGSREFSHELFKQYVMEEFQNAQEYNEWDDKTIAERKEELEDEVLSRVDDGEYAAISAALEFRSEDWDMQDFWEYDCGENTYHFVWCLYAIVWGIQQYDKSQEIIGEL